MKALGLAAALVVGAATLTFAETPEACGTDGYRVQAIYAVAADQVDRYDEVVGSIRQHAAVMDAAVEASAAQQGGTRAIRWVSPDCVVSVEHATLSSTGDDSFNNAVTDLRVLGYTREDRKYLVWLDAPGCGASNINGRYATVGADCWERTDHSSPLHELVHMLGAVSYSAPNSDGSGHCTDDADLMCYGFTNPCPPENEPLLDCNHDDYFDVTGQLDPALNIADEPYFWPNAQPTPSPSTSPSPTCVPRGKSGKCK